MISIFDGVYVYDNQFVFVKNVKATHVAQTENGVKYRPFDVVTKGRRVDMSKKPQNSIN